MKVSDMGEFALIDLIKSIIEQSQKRELSSHQVVTGIGDDAAIWHNEEGLALATTDTLVEGVHFKPGMGTWEELGGKALAVSLSDIAAMGGIPRYALVSLTIPPSTEVGTITALYRGMIEAANRYEVALVGGNTTRATELSITTTVLGSATEKGVLRRSAARPGHLIAVTGYLGLAAAGLRMLTLPPSLDKESEKLSQAAYLRPQPRLVEGKTLVEHGVKAAIDISDGLLSDLGHICQASGVGARIEVDKLPIHPVLKRAFPGEALELALSGGEDYELLFTAEEDIMDRVREEIPGLISIIGRITEGPGEISMVDDKGQVLSLARKGWEHFKG
ncbi:thiamine-phosphate kinase [Chloroflexota bacterium]